VAIAREDGDGAHDVDGDEVRDREIEVEVTVEIGGDDRAGSVAGRELGRGAEGPVAVPEEDRDGARTLRDDRDRVDDGEVRHPVLVEVADRDGLRVRVRRVGDRRLERAVAVAQQHGDGPGTARARSTVLGDDRDVEVPVLVEVAEGERVRLRARREIDLGRERAPRGAEQDGDPGVLAVDHGDVEHAVAVEIAACDRDG
jgi:hypothetical protein